MFLLEHDAKSLLGSRGIPVPAGVLLESTSLSSSLPPVPWVVKAQIAAGGRGKAGLIRLAQREDELTRALGAILGAEHKGMTVHACRVESQVRQAIETYFSLMLDPATGTVRVTISDRGGVDIESNAMNHGAVRTDTVAPGLEAILALVEDAVVHYAPATAHAMRAAARALASAFLELELVLLEINPLFVRADGSWIAGDAKIVSDDDVLFRQPDLNALLHNRTTAYPQAFFKHEHGCDYVVVDPEGEIGLLTTGAGLSMMLIDELRELGLKPYNFLDVRTGGLRGDPSRLITVLERIATGARVRVLLVNIFAGITDLTEFSRLLLQALEGTPSLKVPVVARLAGTNVDVAQRYLGEQGIPVVTELEQALAHVQNRLAP